MKIIAILEVDQAREIMDRLKKASIPAEIHTTMQDSGLEISDVKVSDIYYDRGCGIVETWNADQFAKPKKHDLTSGEINMPKDREKAIEGIAKRKRFGTLAVMVPVFLALVLMLIDSIARLKSGDRPMDYNYKYQPVGPMLRLIVCVVALPLMVAGIWQTFRVKPKRDKPDDDQSSV
jgi:hypothetical protein